MRPVLRSRLVAVLPNGRMIWIKGQGGYVFSGPTTGSLPYHADREDIAIHLASARLRAIALPYRIGTK